MAGLLDAFAQYIRDAMPGGALNSEWNAQNIKRMDSEINRGLLESTGINARDKRRAWNKGLLDAVSGSDDTMSSINQQAFDSVMNLASMAPAGMIKASGNLLAKKDAPDGIKVLPGLLREAPDLSKLKGASNADRVGNVWASGAEGMAQVRPIEGGDYIVTGGGLSHLTSVTPFYAIGDDVNELAQYGIDRLLRATRSINASRTSKIPKDVRFSIEKEFGKNFSYDISNAANSKSYYITHKPTGTKIRVSDHELPSYYENTANIDVGIEDANRIPEILRDYLKSQGLQK